MRGKGRPKAILEIGESNGKILTLFSFLAAFLGGTQGHFRGLGEQSDQEKRDNPYFFCILSYKSPSFTPRMQMLRQLSLVKLLTVRVFAFVKMCRLRNKASFKCLLFTKWLFYIWICWVPTTRSQWGAEGTQHSWELAPGCISIALSLLSILQIWLIFKTFKAWHRTFVLFFPLVWVCAHGGSAGVGIYLKCNLYFQPLLFPGVFVYTKGFVMAVSTNVFENLSHSN